MPGSDVTTEVSVGNLVNGRHPPTSTISMNDRSSPSPAKPTGSNAHTSFGFNHPANWHPKSTHHSPCFARPTHVDFIDQNTGVELEWNSRAHRKGKLPRKARRRHRRHAAAPHESPQPVPQEWTTKHAFPRFWGWDFGDISWWVAQLFLVGSVFWCANGVMFFDYFSDTSESIATDEAVTAFLGGTLFAIGAYLSYVEALNPARDVDFGWELDEEAHKLIERPSAQGALGRKRKHFGKHISSRSTTNEKEPTLPSQHGDANKPVPQWRWYGTDWASLGFTANFIQLCGASIFWISTLCGLPGVLPDSGAAVATGLGEPSLGLWEGLYWTPQILGAPCFVVSAAMFMYEVQRKWYLPAPLDLGWHLGFWNLVGGFGFWFSGIFGVLREVGGADQKWGTAFSTWWGSWAFLIGSYIQLYESLNKI
ncbi:hypothetical protein FRB95_009681 [Tulasnella sp. JGI-2019a]|nr:hypothetical protein FRB95_009681 [Tulasnella sp. JGI-2019a]